MPTYTPLQSIILASSTSSVTFSNIDQNYTDLFIVGNARSTRSATDSSLYVRLNSDTAANYSTTTLKGNAGGAQSDRSSNITSAYSILNINAASTASGTFTPVLFNFINYSNTTTNKNILSRGSFADGEVLSSISLWRSTAAINSIQIFDGVATIEAGSTFDLYGISPVAANNAQAFGGTDIFYDSSYVYHVYKTSGIFTPLRSLTADILVVGGGAGGGTAGGGAGGGGAGGLLVHTSQSLTQTSYTVTVGSGGIGGIYNTQRYGYSGNNSQFGSLTASVGGGGGGGWQGGAGRDGGSGGGGCGNSSTGGAGGNPTSGQGFAGGTGTSSSASSSYLAGGGGGGAGAVGSNGSGSGQTNTYIGGTGGVGSSTYSSWLSATSCGQNVGGTYYIAGGGAGVAINSGVLSWGTAGYGGGGGGSSVTTLDGASNTGGGGAGDKLDLSGNPLGGNGGSGLVIVRYAR